MTINLDSLLGGARLWVSGETVDQYEVVKSPAASGALYVRTTATGSGATDPASDTTNYRPFGGRPIKSIQRGTISITITGSATATVTAVDTAKTELRFLGQRANVASGDHNYAASIVLTNTTTITATRTDTSGVTTVVSWELTEYY